MVRGGWTDRWTAAGSALAPRSLTVAVDGSRFTMIDAGGSVDIFDSRTLRLTGRIPFRGGRPGGATLAPDGRTVAAINAAGDLGFWDAAPAGRWPPCRQRTPTRRRGWPSAATGAGWSRAAAATSCGAGTPTRGRPWGRSRAASRT